MSWWGDPQLQFFKDLLVHPSMKYKPPYITYDSMQMLAMCIAALFIVINSHCSRTASSGQRFNPERCHLLKSNGLVHYPHGLLYYLRVVYIPTCTKLQNQFWFWINYEGVGHAPPRIWSVALLMVHKVQCRPTKWRDLWQQYNWSMTFVIEACNDFLWGPHLSTCLIRHGSPHLTQFHRNILNELTIA